MRFANEENEGEQLEKDKYGQGDENWNPLLNLGLFKFVQETKVLDGFLAVGQPTSGLLDDGVLDVDRITGAPEDLDRVHLALDDGVGHLIGRRDVLYPSSV